MTIAKSPTKKITPQARGKSKLSGTPTKTDSYSRLCILHTWLDRAVSDQTKEILLCLSLLGCVLTNFHFFDPLVMAEKWLFVYAPTLYLLLAFTVSAIRNRAVQVPRIPIVAWLAVGAIWSWTLINIYGHSGTLTSTSIMDRVAFAVLVLSAAVLFKKRPSAWVSFRWSAVIASMIAGSYGLFQYVDYFLSNSEDQSLFTSSYQNINIGAQFSGIAVLAGLSLLFDQRADLSTESGRKFSSRFSFNQLLLQTGVCVSFTYIIASFCRSVMIALPAALIVYFLLHGRYFADAKKSLFKFVKWGSLSATVGILLLSATQILTAKDRSAAMHDIGRQLAWAKSQVLLQDGSASNRVELLRETLQLIQNNPLGIGTDRFVFEFPLYQSQGKEKLIESTVYLSPHNEYLRIVTEEGIPASMILLGLAGSFAIFYFRRASDLATRASSKADVSFAICGSIFVFILIEMFFQFPMNIPMTFFVFAVTLGQALQEVDFRPLVYRLGSIRFFPNPAGSALTLPVVAAVVVATLLTFYSGRHVYRYALATHVMQTPEIDPVQARESCENFHTYWPNCVFHVTDLANQDKPKIANIISRAWLERQPGAYPFLKVWAITQISSDMPLPGCKGLYVYEQLMTGGVASSSGVFDIKCDPFISRERLSKLDLPNLYRRYGLAALGPQPTDQQQLRHHVVQKALTLPSPTAESKTADKPASKLNEVQKALRDQTRAGK